MYARLVSRLWFIVVVLVSAGITNASTPAACEANCVYLPLVSAPELVSMSNIEYQEVKFGNDLVILGEANATTSTPVYSVTLEVRTYDRQGNLLATAIGSPKFIATLPAQPNPFIFGTNVTEDQDYGRRDIRVRGYSLIHPRTYLPVKVTITSHRYEGQFLELAGTLTNEHAVPLEDIQGVAWSEWGTTRDMVSYAPRIEVFETVPFSTSIYVECNYMCDSIPYSIVAQGVVP